MTWTHVNILQGLNPNMPKLRTTNAMFSQLLNSTYNCSIHYLKDIFGICG